MRNWKPILLSAYLALILSATAFAAETLSVKLLLPDGTWLEKAISCLESASLWYASYDASGQMLETGQASAQGGGAIISLSEETDTVKAFALSDNLQPLAPAALLKAPSFYEQGLNHYFNGDYAEAIASFTAAIQADEDALDVYVWRGDAYIASGETAENLAAAQADYKAALVSNRTLSGAYFGLADVYIRRGDYERAIEILLDGMDKASETDMLENKLNEIDSGTVWDSSGNIRRESGYDDNDALVWRHEYSYDEQGRPSAVTAYDADGNQTGRLDLSFDADGNPLLGFNYLYENGKLCRTAYEYDEYGNRIKYDEYDPEGRLSQRNLSQYDQQGYEIRTDYYYRNDETGEVEFGHYILFQYDERGMIVRQDEYSSENVWQSYQTWSYTPDGKTKEYCYYSIESGSPELTGREVSEYNGRGDVIMETRYSADGNVELITIYRYDPYGNRIGITYYDGNGNIVHQS